MKEILGSRTPIWRSVCTFCFISFTIILSVPITDQLVAAEDPCIFMGQLSTQYVGFQNRNETVTSGLSLTVRYGRASDNELKEMTLKTDSKGYFYLKDTDAEAIFFPKLISHSSGWAQELRRATGQLIQPGLQLTTSSTFGSGFSSRKARGGIKVTSMILTLEINPLGQAKWSFSNSIVDTEKVVKAVLGTLPNSDPWHAKLTAYTNSLSSEESPEIEYKRIRISVNPKLFNGGM
jgi:hypothetical protein